MNRKGLSLIEVLVVLLIIVVLYAVLAPRPFWHGGTHEMANRVVSGVSLNGLYQSMYTYSVTQKDLFPIAGDFSEGYITGFKAGSLRGQTDIKPDNPNLINNGTASLWLLVRDGSVASKSFINPSSNDSKDELKDASGKTVALSETWDFLGAKDNNWRKTLSYSFINMYHKDRSKNWSANVASNWVLMGDNNNADESTKGEASGSIHSMVKKESNKPRDIEGLENSTNHGQDGQNFLFGDGHIEFSVDPFVGPKNDNVYAKDTCPEDPFANADTEKPDTPTLDCTDEWTQPQRDVMLIPLTGNHGQNLSDTGRYK